MNMFIIAALLIFSMSASATPLPPPTTDRFADSTHLGEKADYNKYIQAVDRKSQQVQKLVDRRSEKVINRMLKLEHRMKSRLASKDSISAAQIFNGPIQSLQDLKAGLKRKLPRGLPKVNNYLDSVSSTLNFLGAQNKRTSHPALAAAKDKVASLNSSLASAADIKAYINNHRKELREKLSGYTAFSKDLLKINKQAYYYGEQVKEYKELLKDKKKAEAKAIDLLKKTPAYTDFMQKHSRLASLLGSQLPSTSNAVNLEGLQTRSQVEQLIQQRIGGEATARHAITQQMDQARAQLNDLKSKFPDADNAGEMPDFKPNPMKSKRFIQRLEFGGNIQFQKSNTYFPNTTDIAGQAGYKFHKNGTLGIGLAYKVGMGKGWNHIAISHQGIGIRSFIDWKLKGTFFINGGIELNHVSTIASTQTQTRWSGWQESALLGISKKYKINAKLKGNIMVLYDFLASTQMPKISPLKVRVGYAF